MLEQVRYVLATRGEYGSFACGGLARRTHANRYKRRDSQSIAVQEKQRVVDISEGTAARVLNEPKAYTQRTH